MFQIGDVVRVLEPFAESFPDTYEIVEIIVHPDGQVANMLIINGEPSGFADIYIEKAE